MNNICWELDSHIFSSIGHEGMPLLIIISKVMIKRFLHVIQVGLLDNILHLHVDRVHLYVGRKLLREAVLLAIFAPDAEARLAKHPEILAPLLAELAAQIEAGLSTDVGTKSLKVVYAHRGWRDGGRERRRRGGGGGYLLSIS